MGREKLMALYGDQMTRYKLEVVTNIWLVHVIWHLFPLNKVSNLSKKKLELRELYSYNGPTQLKAN